ncbi:tatD [Mytilus edulis]|uniref:Deoxyribonuclease TATDN1 n=1 Tax=Mytilus edulis TaxID=6550 RepID=A0A8S3TJP3_MYTED|nr:tatD [Mytilus edulis]
MVTDTIGFIVERFSATWFATVVMGMLTFAVFVIGPKTLFSNIKSMLVSVYDRRWIVKQHISRNLRKWFPYFKPVEMLSETVSIIPKVNCQAVVVIENLPKVTTAKDLVKCLQLRQLVHTKKLMQLSVAADKKGACAGLAVAVLPRYILNHSCIMEKHNSVYNGNVIKVREVKNRKIKLKKQVNWLSSDNYSHVGFCGRFQVYNNLLQDVTTQYGYYLIDGGSYIQFCDIEDVVEAASVAGVDRIVIKMRNPENMLTSEIEWCKTYPGYLYTTLGASYLMAESYKPNTYTALFNQLEHQQNSKYIVAIGECGISKPEYLSRVFVPPLEKQISLFKDMVKLANHFKKPLLVKSRRGVEEMLDILKDFPDVTACLTIGYETPDDTAITKWIKKGYHLGVTGSVWAFNERNFWIPELLKTVPIDRLILCSNAPYLSYWKKDEEADFLLEIQKCDDFKKVNKECLKIIDKDEEDVKTDSVQPATLSIVLELLASCLNKSPIGLSQVLNANAEKFYKFDSLCMKE